MLFTIYSFELLEFEITCDIVIYFVSFYID